MKYKQISNYTEKNTFWVNNAKKVIYFSIKDFCFNYSLIKVFMLS